MKFFSKSEGIAVAVIFLILIGISVPNFVVSLRRARDQVRKDDMGALIHALGEYTADFGEFPAGSPDGKILACKRSGDVVTKDKKGQLVVNLIPCEWGKDIFKDLTPDSTKVYMQIMPQDPDYNKNGAVYRYYSDGDRYQILVALEGKDEVEIDSAVVARNISCGVRICNSGRAFNCPIDMSIEDYDTNVLKIINEKQK